MSSCPEAPQRPEQKNSKIHRVENSKALIFQIDSHESKPEFGAVGCISIVVFQVITPKPKLETRDDTRQSKCEQQIYPPAVFVGLWLPIQNINGDKMNDTVGNPVVMEAENQQEDDIGFNWC
jgi:hypothetical protein